MSIDYRSPAHFDEEVAVRVRPADGVLVGYDYDRGETVALPDALKQRLR